MMQHIYQIIVRGFDVEKLNFFRSIKALMCFSILFGWSLVLYLRWMHLSLLHSHILWSTERFTKPESSFFLIDIIKLWQGMPNWEKKTQHRESLWIDVQRWIWPSPKLLRGTNGIPGRFSSPPPPRTGRVLARSLVVCGSGETNTHTHSPWCGCKRRWMLPIKQEWMHARMDGCQACMNGEEKWHPRWFIYSLCIHSHPRYLWCKCSPRISAMPLGKFIVCVCLCVGVCWVDICVHSFA